jgi:hypothetical protein
MKFLSKLVIGLFLISMIATSCDKDGDEIGKDEMQTEIIIKGTPVDHFSVAPLVEKENFGYSIIIDGEEEDFEIASADMGDQASDFYSDFLSNVIEGIDHAVYRVPGSITESDSDSDLKDKAFFFSPEGTFERYNANEETWDWGYWYISESGNYASLKIDESYEVWFFTDPNTGSLVIRKSTEVNEYAFVSLNPQFDGTDGSGDWCASVIEFLSINSLLTDGSQKRWGLVRLEILDYNDDGELELFGENYVEGSNIQIWLGTDGSLQKYSSNSDGFPVDFGDTPDYYSEWAYLPCDDSFLYGTGNDPFETIGYWKYKLYQIGETTFHIIDIEDDNIRYRKEVYQKIPY